MVAVTNSQRHQEVTNNLLSPDPISRQQRSVLTNKHLGLNLINNPQLLGRINNQLLPGLINKQLLRGPINKQLLPGLINRQVQHLTNSPQLLGLINKPQLPGQINKLQLPGPINKLQLLNRINKPQILNRINKPQVRVRPSHLVRFLKQLPLVLVKQQLQASNKPLPSNQTNVRPHLDLKSQQLSLRSQRPLQLKDQVLQQLKNQR